jgi:hypothetical protein
MKYIDTFDKHRSEPNKTVNSYLKELQLGLCQQISDLKKIFIDTKYWIYLRDAQLHSVDPSINCPDFDKKNQLLNLLKLLRDKNVAICPISPSLFSEILKNKKENELKVTIKLIDDLSGGISIKDFNERTFLELCNFFYNSSSLKNCHLPKDLIWNKLSLAVGAFPPYNLPFPENEELVIRKVFLDQLWTRSFQDVFETVGIENIVTFPELNSNTVELNQSKVKYSNDYKTFDELLNIEIIGVLQGFDPVIIRTLNFINKSLGGKNIPDEIINSSEEKKVFVNLLLHSLKSNKKRSDLPSIYIPAAIHSSIRWDKDRRFKENDAYDFQHASCAIPYYDYFLTENSLKELISKKSLGFSNYYKCNVMADIQETINELSKLIPQ